MPIIHINNTGLSIYAQFDDATDMCLPLVEGEDLRLRRYELTDAEIQDAELPAGLYQPILKIGDYTSPQDTDMLLDIVRFDWNGVHEVDSTALSGGGVLSARLGQTLVNQQNFMEIVQGEQRILTFIVEGRFSSESFAELNVKIADVNGTVIEKLDDEITRVCEALDVQVLRCTLTSDDTDMLAAGLARVELSFDSQKSRLVQAIKILEKIESPVS